MSANELDAHAARLADATPPAGVGDVAASTIALSLGLCESLAQTTADDWDDARGVIVQAHHLRSRTANAREVSLEAYAAARAQLHPAQAAQSTGRDGMLRASLLAAADALLMLSELAADAAALAATIAGHASPDYQPDAAGAAEMAAAAATSIRLLIDANLALGPDDARRQRAAALVASAVDSRAQARRLLDA
jgi:methenyltetrahydrofolate cyclohydrolase